MTDVAIVVLLGAAGSAAAVAGQWWLVGVLIAYAYTAGRHMEMRWWMRALTRDRERRERHYLEAFVDWAEQTLASAPGDLDAEGERLLDQLRKAYQHAQSELERRPR